MSTIVERPQFAATAARPRFSRWQRALFCLATFLVAPFGWFLPRRFFACTSPERLDQGLVLILPGIEGRSFLNLSLLHGLIDAGVPYALEIVDWTTGNKFLTLYHLRSWRRNLRVAQELAGRIVRYQEQHPERPVWIVGHSGGGGMALLAAQALPEGHRLTGLILLAAAVSPRFDLSTARAKVDRGIWSFHSWLDWLFVGLGTSIFGTMDGRHTPAAGMLGFRKCRKSRVQSPEPAVCPVGSGLSTLDSELFETGYHPRMLGAFHWGGHFSCVHRVFVSENIGPVLMAGEQPIRRS
jgi:pimeloyl-ACP methyl ester carboxylesterase